MPFMQVSIQGYKGSFHDIVASRLWNDYTPLEQDNFPQVFQDVETENADFGVVAIENSVAGAILENYDLLRNSSSTIVGEYYLRIKHNLMALPGQTLKDIKEVRSHPMALKQCSRFLDLHKSMIQVATADTAGSAAEIALGNTPGIAAIASELAAKVYGLQILRAGIETDKHNYTRFLIIAKKGSTSTESELKTSLYIETAHKAGGLLSALSKFESMSLNLTMLVSRPVVGKPWEYGFYLDFVHNSSLDLNDLFAALNSSTSKLQHLGTYPEFKFAI